MSGRPKVESAADRLHDINPDVKVVAHNAPLTSENALEIIREYDIVLNGSDNFPTRYLVNDACHMLGKPLVDGSIFMFEGQATVYLPDAPEHGISGGPCYRCLYPEPPAPGEVPSCAEAGVLGVLPGIVGSIQAIEAIKLILGHRRAAGRQAAAHRHARHELPHAQGAARPALPALRRASDGDGTDRLRPVLRLPGAGART
jgi:molybdopterin/thiamine biosynthesis adenylyltransferase